METENQNETNARHGDGSDSSAFVSCCLTCKHWEGDKVKMVKMLNESGEVVMHKRDGWPEYGGCAEELEWLDIEVSGDARTRVTVPANFGCNYYCADS